MPTSEKPPAPTGGKPAAGAAAAGSAGDPLAPDGASRAPAMSEAPAVPDGSAASVDRAVSRAQVVSGDPGDSPDPAAGSGGQTADLPDLAVTVAGRDLPPPPVALDPPMLPFAVVGTVVWAIAGLVLLPYRHTLAAHGHGTWLWICLAGFLWGFPGLITMLRHDHNRRRRRAAASTAAESRD